jgi:hypothetical protein
MKRAWKIGDVPVSVESWVDDGRLAIWKTSTARNEAPSRIGADPIRNEHFVHEPSAIEPGQSRPASGRPQHLLASLDVLDDIGRWSAGWARRWVWCS